MMKNSPTSRSRIKRSTVLPLILLIYLAAMAWVGRGTLAQGKSWQYYATLAISLAIVVLLHFVLRRKEQLRAQREQDDEQRLYTTYDGDDNNSNDANKE